MKTTKPGSHRIGSLEMEIRFDTKSLRFGGRWSKEMEDLASGMELYDARVSRIDPLERGEDIRTDLTNDVDQKKENHDKATSSSEMCHKCDQTGHSIRNCPMYKANHREYFNTEEGKDEERDQVRPKISQREVFFYANFDAAVTWQSHVTPRGSGWNSRFKNKCFKRLTSREFRGESSGDLGNVRGGALCIVYSKTSMETSRKDLAEPSPNRGQRLTEPVPARVLHPAGAFPWQAEEACGVNARAKTIASHRRVHQMWTMAFS
ncbi:hypothetical protein H5410_004451 [Solanum commersonii]|uniref:CCHC-type domain-containing protein n=1 Tax=Solanum commersonii TaxID=4109 RepID=A0A9J6B7R2_SOLCO|nr:hypothetical protein H5410_004451 [Solanum commersonii]